MNKLSEIEKALEAAHYEFTDNLSKALTQLAALREDYAMVPREPTEKGMAILDEQCMKDRKLLMGVETYKYIYKAIIAAAQTTEKPNDET